MSGAFRISLGLVLLPMAALAADLEFAGSLERVMPESILIRLADGTRINAKLPPKVSKTGAFQKPDRRNGACRGRIAAGFEAGGGPLRPCGALTAEAISAGFELADEVQIACKPMGDQCLELKSIRFLRPPSPKEGALVLGSPMPASPAQPALEHARQVNLARVANMPNFVADETAKRYTASRKSNPPAWKLVDTIESEITFKGNKPTRQHIRINGKPWSKPIPGLAWTPEFGTEIKPVFNPECPTTIDFEGRREIGGKQLRAYRFASPSYGCFGAFDKNYVPARMGQVLVEDPGGSMIQYEEEAGEFPKGFPVQSSREVTSWDYVKIGDASFLLPLTNDFFLGLAPGDLWHISVEFKNYRRFEASTDVTFR